MQTAIAVGCLASLAGGCASGPRPGVAGVYQTWDDVITRWIGAKKQELYDELGPPNLHPKESPDGMTEIVWDMTIDRMPGQANEHNLLPLYRASVNCQVVFSPMRKAPSDPGGASVAINRPTSQPIDFLAATGAHWIRSFIPETREHRHVVEQ